MRINSISMKNAEKGIEISEIFLGKINLFVGLSGVGKTQILSAIYNLKRIIKEDTAGFYGLSWKADFSIGENRYLWEGRFSQIKSNGKPFIEHEVLSINDETIFSRKDNTSTFRGITLPKISVNKSVLCIFSEEDQIKEAVCELMKIHYMTNIGESRKTVSHNWVKEHVEKIDSEETLISSDYDVVQKLALAYELKYEIFNEIKEDYIDVFQQVDDVKIEVNKKDQMCYLSIKEKSSDWLSQNLISAGMYKTLLYIAEMKLLQSQSVVLIDEFENSLGINCITVVADMIMLNERDMQFLITSHHPYIINSIDMMNWRVVMREGSCIHIKSAKELNLGKSRHEFFKQLINSKEYTDGIS